MKNRIIKYLFVLATLLLAACVKEPLEPATPQEGNRIHYRATVSDGTETRAAVNDAIHYIFETGDQLYVEGTQMYGFLSLVSGAGETSAVFEGELVCDEGFYPADDTPLSAVLVSTKDAIHTIENGKVLAARKEYDGIGSDFSDVVSKYGDFTATNTYGEGSFTLSQSSAFLIFSVKCASADVASGVDVGVNFYNDNGETPIRKGTVKSVADTESGDITWIRFATAFPGGTTSLNNAKFSIKWGEDHQRVYSDIYNTDLAANKYYNIARTTLPFTGFRIQAREAETTVQFNYGFDDSGIQYSTTVGTDEVKWDRYVAGTPIVLANVGDEVCFQGTGTLYNAGPLFSADKPCYIYGDLMSLVCDNTYTPKTAVAAYAFKQAFKDMTNIDVPADKKLVLSATTIGQECYMEMFSGCTGLTGTPIAALPAMTLTQSCYNKMFFGCSGLVGAPSLPATTLANNCYQEMFSGPETAANSGVFAGCSSLTSAPAELPATTMKTNCYYRMFCGCSSLGAAPSLPATTLANNCYQEMFRGCAALTSAPANLPAATLTQSCYNKMFAGCSSLVTAPSLPATTLASNCYYQMFWACSSLKNVPESLPADKMYNSCYREMFRDCTSLTTPPTLGATTLENNCFYQMFWGCSKLTSAPALPAETMKASCYYQMFRDCTSLVTAPSLPATTLADNCYQAMFHNCTSLVTPPAELPADELKVNSYRVMFYGCTKLASAPVISATKVAKESCREMFANCTSLTAAPPTLAATTLTDLCYYQMFYKCSNLTSAPAILATTAAKESCREMFYNCAGLVTPPAALSATTLYPKCYYQMFYGCAKLETAPTISATDLETNLAENCCYRMFFNCSKLTTAPALPATKLATSCYREMFQGCSSLTAAPTLPATDLTVDCYRSMFNGTAITTAPALPATVLKNACYKYMFANCKQLTAAPDLPAPTLVTECYQNMFENCSNLKSVKCLAKTGIYQNSSTSNWLKNVPNTTANHGTFYYSPETTSSSWPRNEHGIPKQWDANPAS